MLPNPRGTADLVTFTEEIVNEKLHFLCSVFRTLKKFMMNLFFFAKIVNGFNPLIVFANSFIIVVFANSSITVV